MPGVLITSVIIPLGFSTPEVARCCTREHCHDKKVAPASVRTRTRNVARERRNVVLDVESVRSALWKLSNRFLKKGELSCTRSFCIAVLSFSGEVLRPLPPLSFFLLSSPHKLSRCPGAPSRRRRPSRVKTGRRRRDGVAGPLVSSRAEAEAVFHFLFLFSSP